MESKRAFVSLNISPTSIYSDGRKDDGLYEDSAGMPGSSMYRQPFGSNAGFTIITTNWRRRWKQLSRFQRSLAYMAVVLGLVVFVLLLSSTRASNRATDNNEPLYAFADSKNIEQSPLVQIEDPQERTKLTAKNDESWRVVDLPNNEHMPIPKPQVNKDASEESPESVKKRIIFKGARNERQEAVVKAFRHAWKAYKEYAWGHDHLKPISKTFQDWFGLGLTIVDSLDTIYIMNLEQEFLEAKAFVNDQLDFNINKDVNLFETTIRVLGGLLSAYHLSREEIFLKKAVELGDVLVNAFGSPSGVPYSDINLYTRHSHAPRWGPDSSVSEVATVQLEFKDLSRLTGDSKYEKAADRVTELIHKLPKMDGLVPIYINADTGKFRPYATITLGARGDSYYEYLLKQWLQTGKTRDFLIQDYNESISGITKNLVRSSEPNKLVFVGELTSGKNFRPKMDHLVCYLPSVLALGAHNGLSKEHFQLAEKLIYTCYQMYAQMPTFLAPEIAHFNLIPSEEPDIFVKVNDAHNLLRPETLESLFYMYQLTKNETYQEWGWQIFQAFERYTKVELGGYTTIDNVKNKNDPRPRDMMESFFMAETLKYLYLLFDDQQTDIPLEKYVINSEGHPLPIYES